MLETKSTVIRWLFSALITTVFSATRQHVVRSKSNTGDGSSNKRNAAAEEIKIPANRMM